MGDRYIMNSKFCTRCHRLAAQVVRTKDSVKVMQGRKVLISLGGGSSIDNLSINCPYGHKVKISV